MAEPFRYSRTMIALHWLTAALIAAAWLGAQAIDLFPREARMPARSVHILIGLTLGAALVVRIAARLSGLARMPPAESGLLAWLARATHLVLYVLMAALIVTGIANAVLRGESLFGFLSMAAYASPDRALRRFVGGMHELAANGILLVAGVHAAAALFHHYVLRDTVLRRMLPTG